MYLVHIDTWNYADPQKIIDLIPADIRPYVVMNISLSISHNVSTSQFQVAEYGYEIAKSWLRTCAQNQMWVIVQHSSGGYAQFSDFDLSVYEEFYRDFPNLIGINYAEQFWGYDDASDKLSPKWTDRITHFANLLELSNRYGGYLVVSWCGNQWSPAINPIAMLKRNPAFAAACEKYTENYLLFEKYTQQSYQSDMESICLGAYLSGYSGNYGIRYDDTGWTDTNGEHKNFTMATAGAVHLEHMMLTGSTMIDGPELIWTQCFRETNRKSTTNGYMMRDWETFPQFTNTTVDYFRKILDGTVRIPTRQEVIDHTKFVVINDVNTGTSNDIYSTPQTLFEGLYRMDGDGNYEFNKSFFKKTGRYPTIPTVFKLKDELANSFQNQVKRSAYAQRWPNVNSKVTELNNVFPQEYTGDMYAGRHENGWVIYNPFKTGQTATASIPFKYNTCEKVEMTFSQYAASVMKEYADKLTIYLSNFDNELSTALKTNVIKIYGSTVEPTFSFVDRGNHQASNVTGSWSDGVYTLTVKHNGPLDITVNCAGTATGRLTEYTQAKLVEPVKPPVYTGPRQYEAECFDYKNISGITTAGQNAAIRNYTGQGYLRVGSNAAAAVRDTVYALRKGSYQLITKYAVSGGDVSSIDLFINGQKVSTPVFTKTANESTWRFNVQEVELFAGKNVVEFKASRTATSSLLIDNIVITQGNENGVYHFETDSATTEATNPPAAFIGLRSGSAGVVSYLDGNGQTSKMLKTYSVGALNGSAVADLEMFPNNSTNHSVVWKEVAGTAGGKKGILLRGTGNHGSCAYAEGMKQGYLFIVLNNEDNSITLKPYVADETGLKSKPTFTTTFKVQPGKPYWLRASAFGNQLRFECSSDSLTWEGGAATLFSDSTFLSGSAQLVWGLNSNNYSWSIDNIVNLPLHLAISKYNVAGLEYTQGHGPSSGATVTVSAHNLIKALEIKAGANFEVSLSATTGYATSISIQPSLGNIESTAVYVRLKSGLDIGTYNGEVSITSDLISAQPIKVSGRVIPSKVSKIYNFNGDVASTMAQNPPALYASVGNGSTATAGVVSYTDSKSETSNMFRAYSGGQRNATGAINLERFSKKATDYSVTWKQCVGSGSADYKVGMLLRGDTSKVGGANNGYVQGMMNGYLFLAYTANGGATKHSEFRIYRSTDALNTLNVLVNNSVGTLIATEGQPIWYRATVSGTSPVALKLEYSTNGTAWTVAATASDADPSSFKMGATQIIWGLGAANFNFYLDNILFEGIETALGSTANAIDVSKLTMGGFEYKQNAGPSANQSFTVSGQKLTETLYVDAPNGYELSLSPDAGYLPSLAFAPVNGVVAQTTLYLRLKKGLKPGNYNGEVMASSVGADDAKVALTGLVEADPNSAKFSLSADAVVVSKEYFTLTGQKLPGKPLTQGIYVVRNHLSDNTIWVAKEYYSAKGSK